MFYSTKRWGHDAGFSMAFRQWGASSHCNQVHGYAIAVELTFYAERLNDTNWVMDFGALKPLKEIFAQKMDHATMVAKDDPHLDWYLDGEQRGLMRLMQVDAVGMEALAFDLYRTAKSWLKTTSEYPRVSVHKVQVWEHAGNSAAYVDLGAGDYFSSDIRDYGGTGDETRPT